MVLLLGLSILLYSSTSEYLNDNTLEIYDFEPVLYMPGPYVCLIAGTHGNEPAGTIALRQLAQKLINSPFGLLAGRLRIIPAINQWGLDHNYRYTSWLGGDVNRSYNQPSGDTPIAENVLNALQGADLIIDFHEGWGFHKCQPASVGSTLSPTSYGEAPALANEMVETINEMMQLSGCKLFTVLSNENCTIKSTLGCYMQRQGTPYILVETTGQADVQPLDIRLQQIKIILNIMFNKYEMDIHLL